MRLSFETAMSKRLGLDDQDFEPLPRMSVDEMIVSRVTDYRSEFAFREAAEAARNRCNQAVTRFAHLRGAKFRVIREPEKFYIVRVR